MFKCSNWNAIYKNDIGKLFISTKVLYFITVGGFTLDLLIERHTLLHYSLKVEEL